MSKRKLTDEQVIAIALDKDKTTVELANKFGVSSVVIGRIRLGKSYKKVLKAKGIDPSGYKKVNLKKLNDDQVIELALTDIKTAKKLCEKFDVSTDVINRIRSGRCYKKVLQKNNITLYKSRKNKFLTKEKVLEILDLSLLSTREIADKTGVTYQQVYRILEGFSYKKYVKEWSEIQRKR